MGNNQTKTINSIAERIYFDVVRVEDKFDTFIQNDTGDIDKNQINGGVSSGTMSSETYNADNISIDIWYDISLMSLLRGRLELLEEWIQFINLEKKKNVIPELDLESYHFANEEQKNAFIKRYLPIKEDITLEDIKSITVIPRDVEYGKRGKYMYRKLRTLFERHGFNNYKETIKTLTSLPENKKGRCTSGLSTFLEILKKENQDKFQNSDSTKKFYIKLDLTAKKSKHIKEKEKELDALEESIKSKVLQPIQFVLTSEMKDGDTIKVIYGYNLEGTVHFEDFDWVIPDGFIGNHYIDENITLSNKELPFELKMKLYKIWYPVYEKEKRKLNKISELKSSYDFSFDISSFNAENPENCSSDEALKKEFIQFIENSIDNFVNKSKTHDKSNGFRFIIPLNT